MELSPRTNCRTFHHPPKKPGAHLQPTPASTPIPRWTLIFLSSYICLFWTFGKNGTTWCVVSCLWLLWLNVRCEVIYALYVSVLHLFWLLNRIQCIYCILFIHSQVGGHLRCFHSLAIMNNIVLSSSCGHMFSFLWSRYLGVELLSHMVYLFLTF